MVKIALGWRQLKRQKVRFAVALAGVGVAALLILMQLGFREALFESSVRYHTVWKYDIALVNPKTNYIVQSEAFSRRRLYQAIGVDGVASVIPVYASQGAWRNPLTNGIRNIYVVGIRASDEVFDLPEVNALRDRFKLQDVVIYDRRSRVEFGPVPDLLAESGSVSTELNNRRIDVQGLFELGTSFGIDGCVITSDVNFLRLFPDRDAGLIDFGLIRVDPGRDPDLVAKGIRELLPDDVLVLTRDEWMERERNYWDASTPIGFVFAFGTLVGFIAGAIIVYQILFADVNDHLPEYATLKAMGYSNAYLSRVVLEQALVLAALGYVPGLLASFWLYQLTSEATLLPLTMSLERAIVVLGLVFLMCVISALAALRKVRSADPADVFG